MFVKICCKFYKHTLFPSSLKFSFYFLFSAFGIKSYSSLEADLFFLVQLHNWTPQVMEFEWLEVWEKLATMVISALGLTLYCISAIKVLPSARCKTGLNGKRTLSLEESYSWVVSP